MRRLDTHHGRVLMRRIDVKGWKSICCCPVFIVATATILPLFPCLAQATARARAGAGEAYTLHPTAGSPVSR